MQLARLGLPSRAGGVARSPSHGADYFGRHSSRQTIFFTHLFLNICPTKPGFPDRYSY